MPKSDGPTRRQREFIAAYLGPANRSPVEAARLAGFSHPEDYGYVLAKKLKPYLTEQAQQAESNRIAQADEIQAALTLLARDPANRDHFKALELLSRINGLVSEKVDITVSRAELMREIRSNLKVLAIQATDSKQLKASSEKPELIEEPSLDAPDLR